MRAPVCPAYLDGHAGVPVHGLTPMQVCGCVKQVYHKKVQVREPIHAHAWEACVLSARRGLRVWKEEGPSVEFGDTRASEPQSLCSCDKEARARRLRSPRRE